MFELKLYQEEAVRDLYGKVVKMLGYDKSRQKLVLKAPTGSGKTVIASALLEQLTQDLPERYDIATQEAAFIWIAPNHLHEQSYFKMKNFFSLKRSLNTMRWDEIDHSLGYLKHGDILFLNWESINKDNAIIVRDSEQRQNLMDLARSTQIEHHIPIIVIIDEEHMFAGRNAKKSEKVLAAINPKIELRISATPQTTGVQTYEIDREEVVKAQMIKKNVVLNPAISAEDSSGLTLNQQLLKLALTQRESLKRKYEIIGKHINPLLLIQLPNDDKQTMNDEENQIVEEVTQYLKIYPDISVENHKMAIWLSGKKENLEDIEKPDNMVDVLLFKQAIALGWDCPRAAVLLIFRELQSKTFTVQTVGRILRMPEQKHYSDEALNKGYVYTNLSQDMIEVVKDDMNYLSKYVATRKEGLENITLEAEIAVDRSPRNRLGSDFKKVLTDVFKEEWALNEPYLGFDFDFDDNDDEEFGDNDSQPGAVHEDPQSEEVKNNRIQAGRFINFDIQRIIAIIPKDVTIQAGGAGIYEVKSKAQMARTQSEVERLFYLFCRAHVGSFAKKDSTPVLQNALLRMMEDFFYINEFDAKKIIMHSDNRGEFISIIDKAIHRYQVKKEQERKKAALEKETFSWQIPDIRIYNEDTHTRVIAGYHAMQPFYELNRVSSPEQNFRKFLEAHNESIEWWYKNGDSGRDNFSIVYEDKKERKASFYVDFIIKLRNGLICLFDTKSNSSDPLAPQKHKALIDYIAREKDALGIKMVGGILIGDKYNEEWRYSPTYIDDTESTAGWNTFNPEELCKL